jgi:hypothetical protein
MIPFSDVVRLNQYAQGFLPMAEARAWFAGLSGEQKQRVLRELGAMLQQAHPVPSEVTAAIAQSAITPTHTPGVLMSRGPFAAQVAKVVALPEAEREKAFLLFITLLGIADGRRRQSECAGGCSHWWHQDLADELLIRRLAHGR